MAVFILGKLRKFDANFLRKRRVLNIGSRDRPWFLIRCCFFVGSSCGRVWAISVGKGSFFSGSASIEDRFGVSGTLLGSESLQACLLLSFCLTKRVRETLYGIEGIRKHGGRLEASVEQGCHRRLSHVRVWHLQVVVSVT